MISLSSIVFGFPAPIILALMLNEVKNKVYRKFAQTVTFLPYLISIVVIVGVTTSFLAPDHGVINLLLERMNQATAILVKRRSTWENKRIKRIKL